MTELIGKWEVNSVVNVDALELLRGLPDESVDLIVTSPPYDNLRAYNGYSFEFEPIAHESYRVLKPGGVLVWVVGDSTVDFSETFTSLRQALYFRDHIGFNALDTMIYEKENYAPMYPGTRRYANQFEYMFVFSKGKPSTFNPIQKPIASSTKARRNYATSFIRQDGTRTTKDNTRNNRQTKDASNIWSYSVADDPNLGHPAPFPEDLARDHILTWSNPGDLVLDYFGGSGTTAKMARNNGRNYLTGDISAEYCELMRKRLEAPYTLPLFVEAIP
jgi:DNA modification methylase